MSLVVTSPSGSMAAEYPPARGARIIPQFATDMQSPSSTMNAPATPKPRPARKPKAKLPPAIAHEMDVLRAARMGIDISWMAPDERCKYPSKFCCNKRARKSTGKLHRFCEDHRSRANVNQKRWTEIRRRQDATRDLVASSLVLCADNSWMDICQPLVFPTADSLGVHTPRKTDENRVKQLPPSPTHVDAVYEELPLSEDDIEMLTTIVAMSEQTDEALPIEDAWLMSMLQEVEAPVVSANVFEDLAIDVL